MNVLTVALTRRASLSRPEFRRHWSETHAPLVAEVAPILGIRRYLQLHAGDEAGALPPAGPQGTWPYDGLAQIWFESREAHDARMAEPGAQAALARLRADERAFIERRATIHWWSAACAIL